MSSKAVKNALKSAKQAIQKKDFKVGLKFCKEVLEEDEENYNGLVFCGLCYSELQQFSDAKLSYTRASQFSPDQPLAYQGLVNLFTKHQPVDMSKEDYVALISAYQKLISLSEGADPKKIIELTIGLATAIYMNLEFKQAFAVLRDRLQHLQQGESFAATDDLRRTVVQCLKKIRSSSVVVEHLSEYSHLVFDSAIWYCNQSTVSVPEKEEVLKDLLHYAHTETILTESCLSTLFSFCITIFDAGSSSLVAELLIQMKLQRDDVVSDSADGFQNTIKDYLGPFKAILAGFQHHSDKNYDRSVDQLESGLSSSPDFIPAWLLLCNVYLRKHDYVNAEKSARRALQACKNDLKSWLVRLQPLDELKLDLTVCLAQAMGGHRSQESLNTAKTTFHKLLKLRPASMDIILGLTKLESKLGNWSEAKSLIITAESYLADDPRVRSWKAYVNYMNGGKQEAIDELMLISKEFPDEFLSVFFLGKFMWKFSETSRRDKTKCFSCFLKAAKLNVYHGETFLYLGHYYRDVAKDAMRAKKCYEKAYKLDPTDEDAGSSLADQYLTEDDVNSAVILYEGITKSAAPGACKWAWLRLGLCRLKTKDSNSAIKCFQAALRADSKDYVCWECLGEGYMSRGSYTAAWKTFNKARELNPGSVFGVYQMAAVKQILGQYPEAVVEYLDVLKISPDYVPALKGLGETNLSLAKQMLSKGRDQTCLDYISEAIGQLTRAVSLSGNLSCLWNLIGDSCSLLHPLHGSQVQVAVPSKLVSKDPGNTDNTVMLNKVEMLKLGAKCYSQAISLASMSPQWQSLGVNLYYQAREEENTEAASILAKKSIAVLQKAISLEPNNHFLWNSLGVVAVSEHVENWTLAQHSFIKSVKLEPNNCIAWSNLGSMYLMHSQVELAHKAFKVAQSLEPSYPNSWVGQALVAECIGSEESMDLFRHASELGLHEQAGIGYASCVCALISETADRSQPKYRETIHDMNALSASITQLSKYCNRHPRCDWALTMYGFILERCGLNRSALDAYKRAVDALQSEADLTIPADSSAASKLFQAKINYARSLCSNGKYNEAVDILRTLSPLTQFRDLCVLAVALREAGKGQEAIEAYQQCYRLAPGDEERAALSVAMATLSWKLGDTNKYKEILQPYVHSYLAAAQTLIAIDTAQDKLDRANLQILAQFETNTQSRDVAFNNCLLTSSALFSTDADAACRCVQKSIRKYPFDWRYRDLLSRILQSGAVDRPLSLTCVSSQLAVRNFAADSAFSSINRDLSDTSAADCSRNYESVQLTNASALLVAGYHVFGAVSRPTSRTMDALKAAQRLAHCHPYSSQSWSLLSAACHSHTVFASVGGNSTSLQAECEKISTYVSERHSSRSMREWAIKQNMLSCIADHGHDRVSKSAAKLAMNFPDVVVLSTLSECTKEFRTTGKLTTSLLNQMQELSSSRSTSTTTQMIAYHVYECLKMFKEAYNQLQKLLPSLTKRGEKLRIVMRILLLAIKAKQLGANADVDWNGAISEALASSNQLSEASSVSQVLEGLCRFTEKNYRKSRVSLSRALNNDAARATYCLSKSVAAWYLYRVYHDKNDNQEMEKLVARFENDQLLSSIRRRLLCG